MIVERSHLPTPSLAVAFIGLGTMGAPMAAHLLQAGHSVVAYNRTAAKAAQWLSDVNHPRAATAPSPRAAAAGADLVISCVGNDDDLRQVCTGSEGGFANMKAGALWVDHTTTSAGVARELSALARAQGLGFIDAPVSGGNVGAIHGTLTIMCGGTAAQVAAALPALNAYAKAVTHVGDSGAGQLAKMVNQICIGGLLQGLSEALAFGEKAGLDMQQVVGVISQGAASSWQLQHRGPTMLKDEFDFGFAVDWMRKDLGLVLAQARQQGSALPITQLIDGYYAELQSQGGGRWDTSSLIRRLR